MPGGSPQLNEAILKIKNYLSPQNNSVLDSTPTTVMKALGRFMGLDDPASQAMAIAAPLEAPSGIKAFHGSPYDFDQFSLDKVGSGAGAQAYGHGVYTTTSPQVADLYKGIKRNPKLKVDGKELGLFDPLFRYISDAGGDLPTALKSAEREARRNSYVQPTVQDLTDLIIGNRQMQYSPGMPGRTYELNINASPDHFLDWDAKGIENQPAFVQKAILDNNIPSRSSSGSGIYYNAAGKSLARQPELSSKLLDSGIQGIKYNAMEDAPHSNYVVFDPKIIDIMRKFGIVPPVTAGIMANQREQNIP